LWAGQVALAVLLQAISVLLVQGFREQLVEGPGYRSDRLFLTSFDTDLAHYSEDQAARFYKDPLERTRAAAGVRSAALTSGVPMISVDSVGIVPEGYHLTPGEQAFTTFDSSRWAGPVRPPACWRACSPAARSRRRCGSSPSTTSIL
jgi:hypothetical protein